MDKDQASHKEQAEIMTRCGKAMLRECIKGFNRIWSVSAAREFGIGLDGKPLKWYWLDWSFTQLSNGYARIRSQDINV